MEWTSIDERECKTCKHTKKTQAEQPCLTCSHNFVDKWQAQELTLDELKANYYETGDAYDYIKRLEKEIDGLLNDRPRTHICP